MAEAESLRLRVRRQVPRDLVFDGVMAVFALWWAIGLYLDGRSHVHGAPETFFSLEHAIFYTGYLAMAGTLAVAIVGESARSEGWQDSIPDGYEHAAVGTVVFAAAGMADLAWHSIFGIESDVAALLSPPHLGLAVGGALLVSGPLRAGWHHRTPINWQDQLPVVLSATVLFSIATFMTMYAHPFLGLSEPALGVSAILLQTAILVGVLLVLAVRFELFPGAITLLFVLNGVGMSLLHDQYHVVAVAIVAGVAADLLYAWFDPVPDRRRGVRLFAGSVPVVLYATYFLATELVVGVPWTVHLWTGSIVVAGVVGVVVSYLVLLPPIPDGAVRGETEI